MSHSTGDELAAFMRISGPRAAAKEKVTEKQVMKKPKPLDRSL
jgi:hypothetical protein